MSFKAKLQKGEFVIIAEMNTPKGVDISELVTNARHLKSRIDAVVIPDMDNGVMHMSALAGGVLMQRQGLETLIHIYGRDRNQMALQGDLLSAHVLGLHNLLIVQGEEISNGDHPKAVPVNDLDESGLFAMVKGLQNGTDMSGFDLKGSPDFFTGCTIAPCKDDDTLEKEIEKVKHKIQAGAQFIIIPPVFDFDFYSKMIKKLKPLQVPVIATVFLLKNVGMARYMAINDPCARISEDIITRIRKASDREAECITIAGEMIAKLKEQTQGVKISALGWEHRLPAIIDSAGL